MLPKKISVDLIVVMSVGAFGGSERHTIGLLYKLAEMGVRVVFIESGESLVSDEISRLDCDIHVVRTRLPMAQTSRAHIRQWKQLLGRFYAKRALIIKPWYFAVSRRLLRIIKSRSGKLISIEHTTIAPRKKWSWRLHYDSRPRTGLWWYREQLILYRMSRMVDVVITVSEFNRQCLVANALVPYKRIIVCSNGVDTKLWRRDAAAGSAFRAQIGIPENSFVFGCVGRLAKEKGLELPLEAFRKLQNLMSADNIYLLFVGDGPERDALEALSRHSKMRIRFSGFVSDTVAAYSAIDAILVTTHHEKIWSGESFGLALVEAMSCSCAAIAMACGATPEVLMGCDSAELLYSRDPDEWAGTMRRLAETPIDIVRQKGNLLRRHVITHYEYSEKIARLSSMLLTV